MRQPPTLADPPWPSGSKRRFSRFYVIDSEGKVAYKSGRGPFGFKPGQLEQELVMTLLDQQLKTAAPVANAAL